MSFAEIVFYVLLIDSIGANLVSWVGLGDEWYKQNLRIFSRYFPATKGWTSYYFLLVLWIGYLTFY